ITLFTIEFVWTLYGVCIDCVKGKLTAYTGKGYSIVIFEEIWTSGILALQQMGIVPTVGQGSCRLPIFQLNKQVH
ncbi:MAG TPA: hypothetical protein DCL77_07045, partial [Prolixibacteraceae bacterium]|nr:hypothetical protein [Prolixibacteraceae bacterium]